MPTSIETRVRSAVGSIGQESGAPTAYIAPTDYRYLRNAHTRDAMAVTARLRHVVSAIRQGAESAATSSDCGLTYADGWQAAATLAQLAAFDALARELPT